MYFFRNGKEQHLDLRGDFILTHNDNLVKTRSKSAAPVKVVNADYSCVKKLTFIKRVVITIKVIAFVWGKSEALRPENTNLNEPHVKSKDTETEGRENCPVLNSHCEFYSYQCDNNGEVAIDHCKHPKNTIETEGNAIRELCPKLELNKS